MKTTNGNLPAMPLQITDTLVAAMDNGAMKVVERISGLTKREHFSMGFMQRLIAAEGCTNGAVAMCEALAVLAVRHADALLAELERTNGL